MLACIALVVPKGGIMINENLTFHYPTLEEFLSYRKVEKADISEKTTRLEEKFKDDTTGTRPKIKHTNADLSKMGVAVDTTDEQIEEDGLNRLEFGNNSAAILHPFFAKLQSAASGKHSVRILHYGDSQIEGDRMTAYIRNRLQDRFGGFGPGLISFFNVYNTNSFLQSRSDAWKRFTHFGSISPSVKHKRYGAMNAFARFTPVSNDSTWKSRPVTEAWVEIGKSKSAYSYAQTFNRVRVFYGNCKGHVDVDVYNNGELIHSDTLIPDGAMHVMELSFASTPEKLKYVFKGKDSPDFYGFSLEGAYGIGVDNIAMRGDGGIFVTRSDMNNLKLFYNQLGADLFIMQFGGNAVPSIKTEEGAASYAARFGAQLRALKNLVPDAVIIVIGPSDMANKINGEWQTWPILPTLIEKMKAETFKAGAAYWDMYRAMGGQNSMLSWVKDNLAGPDYTHFTPKGARYVSEMFYEALIYEYQKYKNNKEGEVQ